MQSEQKFYRCLTSDAAARALRHIQEIVADETLSDPAGFARGIALLRGMDSRRRELLSQRCVASVAPFDRACSQAVMQAVYQEMERKVRERCEQKTLGHRADGLL